MVLPFIGGFPSANCLMTPDGRENGSTRHCIHVGKNLKVGNAIGSTIPKYTMGYIKPIIRYGWFVTLLY